MSSTFAVVQGRIVKARLYEIQAPNGQGRIPVGRLVFEVPRGSNGEKDYLPVAIQGETATEVQAFLEATGGAALEALAQGELRRHGGKTEVHAQRVSFLVTGEDRTQAVALLQQRQQPSQSSTKENDWWKSK
jgi:hypothetical protein